MVRRKLQISKDAGVYAAGGMLGIVIPVSLQNWVDTDIVTYPPLFEGPYGKWSFLIPVITGVLGLGAAISGFVSLKYARFLGMYGVTAITTSVLNAALTPTAGMRARAPVRATVRQPIRRNVVRPQVRRAVPQRVAQLGNRADGRNQAQAARKFAPSQVSQTGFTKQMIYA